MKKLDKLKELDLFLGDLELGELNNRLYEELLIDSIPTALHDEIFFGSLFTFAEEMYHVLDGVKHPELKSRLFLQAALVQGTFCVENMVNVFERNSYSVNGQAEYIVCIAWAWLYVKRHNERGVMKLLNLLKSECATMRGFTMLTDFPLLFEKMKKVVDDYMESKKTVKKAEAQEVEKVKHDKAEPLQPAPAEKKVEPAPHPWTLAKGKNTAMAVVLATMWKAGWFVDKEGKPAKSRDQVIHDFMKQAFDADVKNLDQLLSSARRRNKSSLSRYFDELLECLPNED